MDSDFATVNYNLWSLDYGIEAVGFLGKYFDKKCADYLIHLAECWAFNKDQAISSLKNIHKSIENKQNEPAYKNAINCYNSCVSNLAFSKSNLPNLSK